MDPLTHVVVGRAVVAALPDECRLGRRAAAAAILGALAPDVDVRVALAGWDRYLRVHEIGTHSIAGARDGMRGRPRSCTCADEAAGNGPRRPGRSAHVAVRLAGGRGRRRDEPPRARCRVGRADSPRAGRSFSDACRCRSSRWPIRGSSASASPACSRSGRAASTMRTAARCGARRRDRVSVPQGRAARPRAVGSPISRRGSPAGDRSALGIVDEVVRVRADADGRARVGDQQPGAVRRSLSLSQPLRPDVAAGDGVALARHGQKFPRVHEFGFADRARRARTAARRCSGRIFATARPPGVRTVVRRRVRADGRALTQEVKVGEWIRHGRRHRDGRVTLAVLTEEFASAEKFRILARCFGHTLVRRNSTLANGVPAPIGRTSARSPCRAKQSRHSASVRG